MTDSTDSTDQTTTPENRQPAPGYDCKHLPDRRMSDLDLLAFFRFQVGNDVVNEQIAVMGVDQVMMSMQRAHQAHLTAQALTEKQLHQRAEMLESLMLEFGVPEIGDDFDTASDVDRVQMFIRVVKGFADIAAETALRNEAAHFDDPSDEPLD